VTGFAFLMFHALLPRMLTPRKSDAEQENESSRPKMGTHVRLVIQIHLTFEMYLNC
jgi:hypothetical protein